MLDRLKARLVSYNKAAGVEILLLQDGSMDIRVVVLERIKKKIQVQHAFGGLRSVEELKTYIDPDMPLALIVNGRGILNKNFPESFDKDNSIQLFLPNAKPNDFFQQVYHADPNYWVSIVRRESTKDLLQAFKQHNLSVISLSGAAFHILPLLPLLTKEIKEAQLKFAEHTLTISEEKLIDYSFSLARSESHLFDIEGEKIPELLLNSYSAALGCMLKLNSPEFEVQEIYSTQEEFDYRRLFKVMGISLGVFFMSLLLLNFILFSVFSQENKELVFKEDKTKGMLQKMEALEKEVKDKNVFLSEAGWLRLLKSSFYADRIASTIPGSVKLTELTVNPIHDKKTKELRKTVFESGLVKISGNSNKPTDLNEWIDKIKDIPSVENAKLLNYTYDPKERVGNFNVEIIIED